MLIHAVLTVILMSLLQSLQSKPICDESLEPESRARINTRLINQTEPQQYNGYVTKAGDDITIVCPNSDSDSLQFIRQNGELSPLNVTCNNSNINSSCISSTMAFSFLVTSLFAVTEEYTGTYICSHAECEEYLLLTIIGK